MEFFQRAKVFRLKCSHHSKYLIADEDENRVKQSRDSSSDRARWLYEPVEGKANVIRLRSSWSYRYLAASEDPFLLGMTGKKVVQTIKQGPTLEWEVIKEGSYIKLKSHIGSFLRANPSVPPWRNSVTHDELTNWTATDNMILWIVDIVEIDYNLTKVDAIDGSTKSTEEVKGSSIADQKSVHSDSYNKVDSILPGQEDELGSNKSEVKGLVSVSGYYKDSTSDESSHIHPIEVTMAKQTLKELKQLDFHTILSSNRDKKLEKVVNVLTADAQMSSQGNIPSDLLNLLEKLKVMKSEHNTACQSLVEYTSFCNTRLKIMAELKKDAAKACELETPQVKLQTLRAEREELLKQLEEIENVIMDVEKTQADNSEEVEELISRMGQKSQKLELMKSEEGPWKVKETEAMRMLDRVEEEWVKVKTMFPDD